MGEKVTFFDLLGVSNATQAVELWPQDRVLPGLGFPIPGEADDYIHVIQYLQDSLTFFNVRPGAESGRVGLTADFTITERPDPRPLVLSQMPDIGFFLQPNSVGTPARVFVTQAETGVELVLEGLPVEIRLPAGLLEPLRSEEEEEANPGGGPDVAQAGPFVAGVYDSLSFNLSDTGSSSICVHLRVRMTEEKEFVLEPAVPISLGPCRFSGLPCHGVHHLEFIPSPTLFGEHHPDEMALEWTRHAIDALQFHLSITGMVTVRTLDLDHSRGPFKQLAQKFKSETSFEEVEFVLEDLALPLFAWLTPIPTHGRFGVRRKLVTGNDPQEAYDLSLAPMEIELSNKFVDWRLKIFRLLFETPATVIARLALLFGDNEGEDQSAVIDITDGWLLQAAWLPPAPIQLFTAFNAHVSLMSAKVGILLKNIGKTDSNKNWFDHMRILVDLGISTEEDEAGFSAFKLQNKAGKDIAVKVVLRNLGWDLGEKKFLPSLWFPEGLKLVALESVDLEVEEFDWVSENNGGRYLAFSGGISIFPGQGQAQRESAPTPGLGGEDTPNGGGIRFRRLRIKTGGSPGAAAWLLDGVSMFLKINRFKLSGFGMISEFSLNGHEYKEFGLGISLEFRAMEKDFKFGVQLFYGRVRGPIDNFTYWLFGFQLAVCPVGTFELGNIQLLLAGNMHPNLPPPSGQAHEMRLLDWYKQNREAGALEVSANRSLGRSGWVPEDNSTAAGVGADIGLSATKAIILRTFMFFHQSPAELGLLIAAEVFVMKSKQPVGFGALEFDAEHDRWSLLLGVDIDLAKISDTESKIVKGLAALTGTLYAGNKPGTFAIGQLNDLSTWLTLRIGKKLLGIEAQIIIAFCLQIAGGDGPRGMGFLISAKGGGNVGIGKLQFYATFGLLAGVWGNEAAVSGISVFIELGLRIKVFYVFNFGASIKGTFEQLGPSEPNYRRLSCEVRIETPWWLPDVTFRFERISNTQQPERMPAISTPVITAGALQPGSRTETPLYVTPLLEDPIDPTRVYEMAELRNLPAPAVPDAALESLEPVSLDSIIAVNFKAPVDNLTTIVPNTPHDAGLQRARPPAKNDLSTRYELVEVGIRRRAHFGPQAGVWTDLLAPADSHLGGLEDLIDDSDIEVRFQSAVSFFWDDDLQRDGQLDPRRLLINAETPYSFVLRNPAGDEAHLRADPGWPCCPPGRRTPVFHVLDFSGTPFGSRASRVQAFSDSQSTLHWTMPATPQVVHSSLPPAESHAARVIFVERANRTFAAIRFDQPAFVVQITAFWQPVHVDNHDSAFIVESYRGLKLVDRQEFPLIIPSAFTAIQIKDPEGITSVSFLYRATEESAPVPSEPAFARIEFVQMRYRTVSEELEDMAADQRCKAHGEQVVDGGGKLAWLPNHDYEITLTSRVVLDYQGSAQDTHITQKVAFRTKGLPGLNAVHRVGDELEPYVVSLYPGSAPRLLYRSEPLTLAFNELFNNLLPVERTPSPQNPEELNQVLEWVLAVDKTSGERISLTSPDWVVTHRSLPLPPVRWNPAVLDAAIFRELVRQFPTNDPFRQRLENLVQLSPTCDLPGLSLHRSQVLVHDPVNPGVEGSGRDLWEPGALYRANVRQKDGPFVERVPFDRDDSTAFTFAGEGGSSVPWTSQDGTMRLLIPAPDARLRFALFGERDWDHLQVHASLDPEGAAAGVAMGVAGQPQVTRAIVALIDENNRTLSLSEWRSGSLRPLAMQPLPTDAAAPYMLEVIAFDDRVRARQGETVVEALRGDFRAGRVGLVARGGGVFHSLVAEPLDAYRFHFQSSRYATFEEHITSWDGTLASLPPLASAATGTMLEGTSDEIAAVMAYGSDRETRQRLFDRWTSELGLPLRRRVDALCLSTLSEGAGVELLMMESPEPLPFSEDVSLTVKRRTIGFPQPLPPGISRPLSRFTEGLVFSGNQVSGPIPAGEVDVLLRGIKTLVRSLPGLIRLRFAIYNVEIETDANGNPRLIGQLDHILNPIFLGQIPPSLQGMKVDHIALIDRFGQRQRGFIPLPVEVDVIVPLHILSNAAETCALLIPDSPLVSDTYRFEFALNRPRFATHVSGEESNYRAKQVQVVRL